MGGTEDKGFSYYEGNQTGMSDQLDSPFAPSSRGETSLPQCSLGQSSSVYVNQVHHLNPRSCGHAQEGNGSPRESCHVGGDHEGIGTIKVPFVASMNGNQSKECDFEMQKYTLRDERKRRDVKGMDFFKTTVLHMDSRRLSRRLNGVRQKPPHKRITLIMLFCLILEAWDILYSERVDGWWRFGIEVRLTAVEPWIPILVAVALVIFFYTFAHMLARLSIPWPVEATYIFVIGTSSYAILSKLHSAKWPSEQIMQLILLCYLSVEAFIFLLLKGIIFAAPRLARRGWWCCCLENLRIIDKSEGSVLYSRYKDCSAIFSSKRCFILGCVVISFARIAGAIFRRPLFAKCCKRRSHTFPKKWANGPPPNNLLPTIDKAPSDLESGIKADKAAVKSGFNSADAIEWAIAATSGAAAAAAAAAAATAAAAAAAAATVVDPDIRLFKTQNDFFSYQLRYKGGFDGQGRPHGYGEWMEDNKDGERLQGIWFHGIPVGPFVSQEVGSGSIFVNSRVGFCYSRLNTILPSTATSSSITLGVSATETSISGNFFVGFPRTYFFDPDAVSKFKCCTSALGEEPFAFLAGRFSNSANHDCRATQSREDGYWACSRVNDCFTLKVLFKKRIEDCRGVATIHWVMRMLHHHMHIQKSINTALAEDDTSLQIHFDKHTNGIRIPGYEFVGRRRPGCIDSTGHSKNQIPYGVRVVLAKPRQRKGQRFVSRYSTLPLKLKVATGATLVHGFVHHATPCRRVPPLEKAEDECLLNDSTSPNKTEPVFASERHFESAPPTACEERWERQDEYEITKEEQLGYSERSGLLTSQNGEVLREHNKNIQQPQVNNPCTSTSSSNHQWNIQGVEKCTPCHIIPSAPPLRKPTQHASNEHTPVGRIQRQEECVEAEKQEEARDNPRKKRGSWCDADDTSDRECCHRTRRGSYIAAAAAKRIMNMTSQTGVRRQSRNKQSMGKVSDNPDRSRRRRKRSSVPRLARLFRDEDEVSSPTCLSLPRSPTFLS